MVAILQFLGTNCEYDMEYAFSLLGVKTQIVWHKDTELPKDTRLVVIPGGFSYGDYLRSGAIARFSPIMQAVVKFANAGGYVLGICNGFQILLESGLLPGAMKRNTNLHFISKNCDLKVVNNFNIFLEKFQKGDTIKIPIAHADGNYYIDEAGLKSLEANDQILLEYVENPNGSVRNIAGICNVTKNVFGLMPHPERAIEKVLGEDAGLKMLQGFLKIL
ncbi:phosphoribosylformylglycinamidine synthase subunit PurQ [Helicobacter winghamensis]|uniref:Phosphoribosylformylglycinamidine synthase subunit PurQ n=1 Tax=Helicobacter winghamensis TaxID=157268 RepID=A0A2N3PJP0_9HELI|nr:phosphoribosylformylglycinamidine synthase subunit PurQ [Helicobacter winghamensis]EEO26247.1 phosphoribosylformylglycinamidine synthase I [Helicobacter winghamensis ATCC BAA-430]PKT77241.1 phosphoribosylformylglycinamidine synthase I [Helicobacter winghamensis]PKT77441.1 phosphoribosylformylglycinamidine synthase I [Helicobacter winghamensis]PKT77826.1 phosphoribosylformylglycinamidine synthase I [Helicobacter winghamensis]PKT81407.1 phosphoribosylformylglycinamidine synthase I [Helicobact